jgi:hypothetical protein
MFYILSGAINVMIRMGGKHVDEIKVIFKDWARIIWGNSPLIDKINFTIEVVDKIRGDVPAVLVYSHKPQCIGSALIRVPKDITLRVTRSFLAKPDDYILGIIGHEAVHLGCPAHNRDFFALAKYHKLPVSLQDAEGGRVMLQIKVGSRYQTIETFDTQEEAKRFFKKEYLPDHPKAKGRIQF